MYPQKKKSRRPKSGQVFRMTFSYILFLFLGTVSTSGGCYSQAVVAL
jgi:hypothetical protein